MCFSCSGRAFRKTFKSDIPHGTVTGVAKKNKIMMVMMR